MISHSSFYSSKTTKSLNRTGERFPMSLTAFQKMRCLYSTASNLQPLQHFKISYLPKKFARLNLMSLKYLGLEWNRLSYKATICKTVYTSFLHTFIQGKMYYFVYERNLNQWLAYFKRSLEREVTELVLVRITDNFG